MIRALFLGTALAVAAPLAGSAAVVGQLQPAEPVTEARLATFPADVQAEWHDYLSRSDAMRQSNLTALLAERGGKPGPASAPRASKGNGMPLNRPVEWYGGTDARHVADNIVSFQAPAGSWGKNVDRTGPLRQPGEFYLGSESRPEDLLNDTAQWSPIGTFDNGATTAEIMFLARIQAQLPGKEGDRYREALVRGVRYTLAAQYPNGGWPQYFPLRGGYHDAVTYNDDAISDILETLAKVASRQGDFAFIPADLARAARVACDRGIAMILQSQVIVDGKRTIWGQQHDAVTLAVAGARNFEPAVLAPQESAELLIFLMKQPDPSPQLVAAVEDGIGWLRAHAIDDYAWVRSADGVNQLLPKPGAKVWPRYYDQQLARPVFGGRDRSIFDDLADIPAERRDGYNWYGDLPARAIDAYAKWAKKP